MSCGFLLDKDGRRGPDDRSGGPELLNVSSTTLPSGPLCERSHVPFRQVSLHRTTYVRRSFIGFGHDLLLRPTRNTTDGTQPLRRTRRSWTTPSPTGVTSSTHGPFGTRVLFGPRPFRRVRRLRTTSSCDPCSSF